MSEHREFHYRLPQRIGGWRPGSHRGSSLGAGQEFVSHMRLYDRPDPTPARSASQPAEHSAGMAGPGESPTGQHSSACGRGCFGVDELRVHSAASWMLLPSLLRRWGKAHSGWAMHSECWRLTRVSGRTCSCPRWSAVELGETMAALLGRLRRCGRRCGWDCTTRCNTWPGDTGWCLLFRTSTGHWRG